MRGPCAPTKLCGDGRLVRDSGGPVHAGRDLIGAGPAVAAGVGAGDAHAVRHQADRLHGARTLQVADTLEHVATTFEATQHLVWEIRLDGQRAVAIVRPVGALPDLAAGPAWQLQGRLQIGIEVEHGNERLQVDLHLVVGARRA